MKVVYNSATSGIVDAGVIRRRGAVACAAIDAIGRAGLLADVVFCEWVRQGSSYPPIGIAFPLKRPDEPMNMDRTAFALAHPSMFRRVIFAVEDTLPEEIRRNYMFYLQKGHGVPCEAPKEQRGDIYFPCMRADNSAWSSDESAEEETIKMLKSVGVIEE